MADISTKPYLIRAIHEWCTDSGYRPYIAVVVDEHTVVPREFVRNGEIVLNVSSAATNRLRITNELIEFEARFGGVPRSVSIPMNNVSAIYAQETGHGMAFEVPKALALAPESGATAPGEVDPAESSGPGGNETLREVDPVSSGASETGELAAGSLARRSASHSRRPRLAAVPSSKRSHTGSDANGKGPEAVAKEGPDGAESGRIESGQGGDSGTGIHSGLASDTGIGIGSDTGTSGGKDSGVEVSGARDSRAESAKGKPSRRRRKEPLEPEAQGSGSGTDQSGQASDPAGQARSGKAEAGASEAATPARESNDDAADTGSRKAVAPGKKASQPSSEDTPAGEEKSDRGEADRPDAGQARPDDEPPSPPVGRPRLRRVK